jgi:two-component SAPR family response regulator
MLYKVVIVDDEPLAIEVLNHYLKDEEDFTIINSFTRPTEALVFLNTVDADVLFLDINMAVLNGIELLKQLKKPPLVVFTTAHKQYLQEGFDHGILDYLQKPIKKDRLKVTLERIKQQHQIKKEAPTQIHINLFKKNFISILMIYFLSKLSKITASFTFRMEQRKWLPDH